MSYQTWRTFFGRGRPGGVRMSIKDWPERERPREKLLASGAQALSDAELLAVLLGSSGRRGVDAVAMARNLLGRHQSLRALLSAAPGVCLAAPGIGADRYCIRPLRRASSWSQGCAIYRMSCSAACTWTTGTG